MTALARVPLRNRHGLVLALGVLLVGAFLRCPTLFLHGRIWAEESSVLLAHNWNLSFRAILLAPQLGYFSLWDNLWAALAIRIVPLQFAAYLFTGSAVLVLLVSGYLVYEAEFFITPGLKVCAVICLLVTTGNIESWLNLINSGFSFGLWSVLILLSRDDRQTLQRVLALSVAVLSGPITVLLTPFFLYRAWRSRTRGAALQAAVVLAGSSVQAFVALTSGTGNRKLHFTPSIIGPIVLNKDFIFPILSRPIAGLLGKAVLRFPAEMVPLTWFLLTAAVLGALLLFRRSLTALAMVGIAMWLGTMQALLALGGTLLDAQPGFGERYAYVPDTLMLLALLLGASAAAQTPRRTITRVLLCGALCAGAMDYLWLPLRVPSSFNVAPWYPQAVRWQHDETTPLRSDPDDWPALYLPHQHPPRR